MMEKLLLSYREAASLLGVSVRTLARLIEGGEIRTVRVHASPRIARSEVDRYIAALLQESQSKPQTGGMPHAAS